MKKMFTKISATLLCFLALYQANAQETKIAYMQVEYVMGMLPEYKTAQSDLEAYSKNLEKQMTEELQPIQEKFNTKLEYYQKNKATMDPKIQKMTEDELAGMQAESQQVNAKYTNLLKLKEGKLSQPILEKIEKAMKEVAKENGYTMVLKTSAVLFDMNEEKNEISNMVLKKLGVEPAKETE